MTRLISTILLLASLSIFSGCGYSSSALLPEKLDSIKIENFTNKISTSSEVSDKRMSYSYRPGLEIDITRAVIDGFIFDRHLRVKSKEDASLLMTGALVDYRQFPLSYDKNDNVQEFRVEISVDIELYDSLNGKVLWTERGFMGQSTYTVSGQNAKTDAQAAKDAVQDLAKRIVERTVEAW